MLAMLSLNKKTTQTETSVTYYQTTSELEWKHFVDDALEKLTTNLPMQNTDSYSISFV